MNYKEKQGRYGGLYRLRNGIVVEAYPENPEYSIGPVKTVSLPDEYDGSWRAAGIGDHGCLLVVGSSDPLHWSGGAHGDDYDIVERVDKPQVA